MKWTNKGYEDIIIINIMNFLINFYQLLHISFLIRHL